MMKKNVPTDGGALYKSGGKQLIRVESVPCDGQYSHDDDTGEYKFTDADIDRGSL